MDNYKILTDKLTSLNQGSFVTELVCIPTDEQRDKLKKGSGNPEAEMRQVNSSAGLAVNYWRAYELCHPNATIEFEWKERVPLKSGRPANVDVVVREEGRTIFIESKFLEPYYSGNEISRDSYLDATKYSSYTKDSPKSWIAFFEEATTFSLYNVTQLGRHLLAVSKDIWLSPKAYENKHVQLLSVTWEMSDSFISLFPDEIAEEFKNRRIVIREEAERSEAFINGFIKEHLDFANFEYKAIKYNDIIDEIKDSQYVKPIKKQYFL